ncbi:MAG: hypothetical protein QOD55_1891 [Solirubrobacteraceae bacterium]|nr:hypothetical protein [Solirubrobacteraceae bacterium]
MTRIRTAALGSVAAGACACAMLAAPAFAAQGNGAVIRPGNHILVVHNIDFVGAFGNHTPGETMSIDVYRGDHHVAHAAGPAVAGIEGTTGGLETNHGPEGAPGPGDCWDGGTPDIKPGDRVVVTDSQGGQDSTYVDDLSITDIVADPAVGSADILVRGAARNAVTGDPLPATLLDSGAWRTEGVDSRGDGPTVTVAADGTYEARYAAPGYGINRGGGVTQADVIGAGHEFGYGHVTVPAEIQLVEGSVGAFDSPGPAPGCEAAAPAAGANAITTSDDGAVSSTSEDLSLGGVATGDTTGVTVSLSDGSVTIDGAVEIGSSDVGDFGDQGFTATFDRADLDTLADGPLTATATFTGGTGPASATRTIAKDTVAPGAPTANPPSGSYVGTRFATLASTGSARIRYTTNGADPAVGGQMFTGFSITVSSSRTIRAVGIDAAGNVGPEASFTYTITAPATGGGGGQPAGGGTTPTGGAATVVRVTPVAGPLAAAAPAAAPAGAVAGVTTSSPAPLSLRQLTVSRTLKRSTARRAGLRLAMRVANGTRVVRIRVYRKRSNGFRTLVAEAFRAPTTTGQFRVGLTTAKLRRSLSVGSYEVEVTPGTSRSSLGRTSRQTFRVTR